MTSALGNLTVVDFSRVLAGPFATMMLADLGATVLKIERGGPGQHGDETRTWGPPFDGQGGSTYFHSVNRNKTCLALDLADPVDLERARELVATADVLVENFRPGVMERLGLGADDLQQRNDRLIYCSITGFGTGAGAALPGYDLLIQALGGLMSITGEPDGEPQKVGVALVDVLTGLFATVGILAALRHRDATGEAQRIEVNLLMSLLAALVNQGAAYTVGGTVPTRLGNAHPSIAPYELLACAEGSLVVAAGNDRQFAALCATVGAPGLATEARYATNTERVRHRDALRTDLERLLAARTASQWAPSLLDAGVPAGEVNDIAGAFDLAARLGLRPTVDLPRPDGSTVALTRNPIDFSRTPPVYTHAAQPLPA